MVNASVRPDRHPSRAGYAQKGQLHDRHHKQWSRVHGRESQGHGRAILELVALGKAGALTAGQGDVTVPVMVGNTGTNIANKLPEGTTASPGNIFTCQATWDQVNIYLIK